MNTSTLDSRTYAMAYLLNEMLDSSRDILNTIFNTVDVISESDFLEVCNLSHDGIEAHKEAEHSWYLDYLIEERSNFIQNRKPTDPQSSDIVIVWDNLIASQKNEYPSDIFAFAVTGLMMGDITETILDTMCALGESGIMVAANEVVRNKNLSDADASSFVSSVKSAYADCQKSFNETYDDMISV